MDDFSDLDTIALVTLHALASNPAVCTDQHPTDERLVTQAFNLARAFMQERKAMNEQG